MVTKSERGRGLPEQKNPLLDPAAAPAIESLIERRRLGRTDLAVYPGQVGLTNATNPTNIGILNYAHLKVPLPRDLAGSGIYHPHKTTGEYPDAYYLMRRSNDGYVSATGMFKAAFPWASLSEEEAERRYQKTFPSATGADETAGSVWISPEEALTLAEEYSVRHWLEALLHPATIKLGNKDKEAGHKVDMPPHFDIETASPAPLPAYSGARSTRARSTRSVSPSKIATPSRKIATPRKPRRAKADKLAAAEDAVSEAVTPSAVMQDVIANGATPPATGDVNGESEIEVKEDTVHVEVEETVETQGNIERTTTTVKIDVPHSHAELPEPEDPAKMIAEARRMVEEAQKLEGGSSSDLVKVSKRKVDEVLEAAEEAAERSSKAARTAYTTEQKLTKEKVTRRALVGLTVMAAVGTFVQYFS